MNPEFRAIILTLIVSASITLAIEYGPPLFRHRPAPLSDVPPNPVSPPPPDASRPNAPRPVAPAALSATAAPAPSAVPAERAESPPAEDPAEEMPVALHIRNRRDLNLIDGDIRNIAGKPLSITLRAVNSNTQGISEIRFQLGPGERKSYSTNDGLEMQANDQLIVQSPPYPERVIRVP